jgi:hypothetical protein
VESELESMKVEWNLQILIYSKRVIGSSNPVSSPVRGEKVQREREKEKRLRRSNEK